MRGKLGTCDSNCRRGWEGYVFLRKFIMQNVKVEGKNALEAETLFIVEDNT